MSKEALSERMAALLGGSWPIVTHIELERRFDRHFAAKQISSDIWGCCLGACIYLSLLPSLASLSRPDLVAAAVGSAAFCLWPFVLSRGARQQYERYRDYLLLVHFLYNYGIGGRLGQYVRLHQKLGNATPATFIGGYILSSTVLWQCLDTLMYRMRFRRFLCFKPLILLASLPLELKICGQTCQQYPAESRFFHATADHLRLFLSPFRLAPLPLSLSSNGASAATSCFKVQAFLLVCFSWLLPAYLLYRLEKQAVDQFRQECGAVVLPASEAASDAALVAEAAAAGLEPSGSTGAAAAGLGSSDGGSSSIECPQLASLRRRVDQRRQELQRRWQGQQWERQQQQQWEQQQQQQGRRRQQQWLQRAGEVQPWDDGESGWVRGVRALVFASLAWYVIDTIYDGEGV